MKQSRTAAPDWLIEKIPASGLLSLEKFVHYALTDPKHGYYSRRESIGIKGDFTTAPEISPLFGEFIGLWLLQAWLEFNWKKPFSLIEAGPGRGTLMADILRVFRLRPEALENINVHLVEVSPKLREIQRKTLGPLIDPTRLTWHDDFTSLPAAPSLFIANEFLDALPAEQFIRHESGWQRINIKRHHNNRLSFYPVPSKAPCHPLADKARIGDMIEYSDSAIKTAQTLAQHVITHEGAGLFIDYGSLSGSKGPSFQALYNKKPVFPLDHVGEADLTFHVDFFHILESLPTPLFKATTSQRNFLNSLGLGLRLKQLQTMGDYSTDKLNEIITGANRLIHPGAMGALFNVLALSSRALNLPPLLN